MPKSINLGNGSVLIGLGRYGQVKNFYFHYPGLENHVSENLTHKIGIYVDDSFSWIDDGKWQVLKALGFSNINQFNERESNITELKKLERHSEIDPLNPQYVLNFQATKPLKKVHRICQICFNITTLIG